MRESVGKANPGTKLYTGIVITMRQLESIWGFYTIPSIVNII